MTPREEDFPAGHPKRFDYDPESPEAKEWARLNIHPKGERDFPVGHPKAVDTPGNTNHVAILPGVDPEKPHLEAFTGRTAAQAEGARRIWQQQAGQVKETAQPVPLAAPNPPAQPGVLRARVEAGTDRVTVFCPACDTVHIFDSRWKFNGNVELPTFTPSYVVNADDPVRRCHSLVINGTIQYLPDCGHALAGTTVDLPPITASEETIHA